MVLLRKTLHIMIALCAVTSIQAAVWRTHFAYNNVTQIAMSSDKVYAISDGSLFSVDKQTEQMKVYNSQSGLHGTGITCIHYDDAGKQLIIAYGTGKIDILSSRGVHYVGDLYDKDMTQRKTIYNVTISGRTAYLSTHYGVQTMDLRENKLVDSYWLRPNGEETPVKDVLVSNDSIYAFADDSLYCASLGDNLSDYTVWKRELRGRIEPDEEKGIHYQDATDHWFRGYGEGIIRFTPTDRLTYKPQGPLENNPYRLRACGNRLGMVQGAYAIPASRLPGIVMILQDGQWRNFDANYINSHVQADKSVTDICDIAFDPSDPTHYYVASFGYGLMEFRQDTFYHHYNPDNSALEPVIPTPIYPYVWVDGLQQDAQGNLWMLNNSYSGVKVLMANGNWVSISNAACQNLDRSKDLLISVSNPNIKFVSSIRNGIGVFDDNGTIEDQSDDRAVLRVEFFNEDGNTYTLNRISSFLQTPSGVLLIGTQTGLYRINSPEEMLNGNTTCSPVVVNIPEEGKYNILETEDIRSLALGENGQIWIGTQTLGAYCLSADLEQVVGHVSVDNSPMPNNDVLSMCYMASNRHMFFGTAEGLVEYDPDGQDEGLKGLTDEEASETDEGSMQRWRLHLSYINPSEIDASAQRIYAAANGALFSLNRADESLEYWNKATGLNGNSVSHIAYDALSEQLMIAYEDGRIDLLDEEGTVTQMPDLYMKAGAVAVTIHCLATGSRYAYAGTSFGIIALNTRKAETADTYYIGSEAAAVEVQQIAELGDSLYAFSYDRMYKASLRDNLVDYTFWTSEQLPCERVSQVQVWKDALYTVQHDSLYRREGSHWQLVRPEPVQWIHANDGQLLVYLTNGGLFRLTDEGQLSGLSNTYNLNNALFTNGEYWAAETNFGLIRLGSSGDDYFHTEGPNSNFGYCMYAAHDRIYSATGGRWAAQFVRPGRINIYEGNAWRCIDEGQIGSAVGVPAYDISSVAVDPQDPGHFFAAAYGRGVFEFKNYTAVKHYTPANSTLREAAEGINPNLYTFVDGVTMDEEGNLWVLNNTAIGKPLHVLTPYGQWFALQLYSGGQSHQLITPTGIWTDKRNSHHKWMMAQRSMPKVVLLDDGGTPTLSSDDRCMVRSSFVDQNGNVLSPSQFRCWAQDEKNRIWIGTEKGVLLIEAKTDFFKSNACRRIIIPRNDGTGLGDYLLGDEQINCMAVDGGDRMWIGTTNSGLYLIEDDTIVVAHFTETNSLLPSNTIQSIAIMPRTGEVFVGTDRGIASYRSDASEPHEDMSEAYAFPNPVRPGYTGMISIAGLMENTVVNIVDAGGNLVCKTKSHGGTAVWDGKLQDGRYATPGIYTALCNEPGGKHTVVKILVIR